LTLLEERNIRPMLAETTEPFDSPDFFFEPKWDGMRCIAYIRNKKVELQNRNLTLVTKEYPELEGIPSGITSKTAVLDGEIVVLQKGIPSFEDLQKRFGSQTLSRTARTCSSASPSPRGEDPTSIVLFN
jgi:bifunctional non-homologous end joining protein LigD